MKINEFAIVEPQVDEAPQGMLKRTGLGIAKAFGSNKAAGKLEAGKLANTIKNAFMKHLGKIGGEASAEELIAFLKLNKYPTQNVEKMAQQMAADAEAKANKNKLQPGPENDNTAGESIEEAELKGKEIDQLIMKAAQDAGRMQSGLGLGGGSQTDTKNLKKGSMKLKSLTKSDKIQMQTQAIQKLANGEIIKGQEAEAVAPLMKQLAGLMSTDDGVNKLRTAIKQAQSKKN